MSLLFRQLGVVAFEPLKPHMLELYNASHAVLPGLQVGPWGLHYLYWFILGCFKRLPVVVAAWISGAVGRWLGTGLELRVRSKA